MAKLRPDEKILARALLASGHVDRESMQAALGRLKVKRRKGSPVTLQDILVKRGLAEIEDIEEVLGGSRKGSGSGDAWRAYTAADSVSFVDSLERRRKKKKKLAPPVAKTAPELDETMPIQMTPVAPPEGTFGKQSLLAAGFALEETGTGTHDGSQTVSQIDQTLTMNTHEAAEAALQHIKARAAAEKARSESRLRERRVTKQHRIRVILGAAVGVAVLIVLALVFLRGNGTPEPDLGKDLGTIDQDKGKKQSDQIQALFDKAEALETGEKYGDAVSVWEQLKSQFNDQLSIEQKETVRLSLLRVSQLEVFQRELEAALKSAEDLRSDKKYRDAIETLSGVLDRYGQFKTVPMSVRAKAWLVTVFDESNAATNNGTKIPRPSPFRDGKEPKPIKKTIEVKPLVLPAEPKKRKERFQRLASLGQKKVDSLRAEIDSQKKSREAQVQLEAKRAIEATKKRPLKIEISKNYTLNGAVVKRYDSRGFTLDAGGSEISFLWSAADLLLAYRIRKLGAQNDPRSLMDLGRFCVEQQLFDEARQVYSKVLRAKPSWANQIPDVETLERQTRLFQGHFQPLGGGLVELEYDFRSQSQLRDFDRSSKADIKSGRLELRGDKIFPIVLKNLIFEDRVTISMSPRSASRKALIACGFVEATGKNRRGILLAYQPQVQGLALLNWRNGGTKPLKKPTRLSRTPKRLDFEWRNGQIKVRADGRTIFQVPWNDSQSRLRVVLAGISREEDVVSYNSLGIKGDVGRVWLRKTVGAAEARLRAVMAGADDLTIYSRNAGNKRRHQQLDHRISAEDSYAVTGLSRDIKIQYKNARDQVQSSKIKGFLAGLSELQKIVDQTPGFAAAHYRLALGQRRLGRTSKALWNAAMAVDSCSSFYEAMALRSLLLIDAKKTEEAMKWAEAALKLKPDHALARYARGRLYFLDSRLKEAFRDLEMSVALDPWNSDAVSLKRNISHVLAGPPWERTFIHETDHYRVETDISQTKAEYYGRHLEAIRSFYCEQFGVETYTEKKKKARVLIFDTREGFHSYAKLTTDDRVESFLGYYHPRFQQLLLYEDRKDVKGTETLRVLYHEGFHQFTHGLIPQMPFWLAEGLAEYYAGSRIESGTVVARGTLHKGRIRDLKRYLKGRSPISFKKLMLETPSEFYSGPVAVKYAQAWSMCHFFCHSSEKRLRALLFRYVLLLKSGKDSKEAFDETFAKIKLKTVERAWLRHVKAWD